MSELIELFDEFCLRFYQGLVALKHRIKDTYCKLTGEYTEE